jgi:hypothetical protein
MNYSSASGSSVHATVNLIMAAKPLEVIVRQPTMASMDKMTEQMAQMVVPVKTTPWGGLHGSLALVLDNADYEIITKVVVKSTTRLGQPASVNPKIKDTTSQLNLLTLQAKTKRLQKEFDLQEAGTTIGVHGIIDSVKEQYVEELNEEYFGYANQTIKTIINHLCTNWCKVMMKERTDATEAFYHAWVPNTTHIITFGHQLTMLQKNERPSMSSSPRRPKPSTLLGKCIDRNCDVLPIDYDLLIVMFVNTIIFMLNKIFRVCLF